MHVFVYLISYVTPLSGIHVMWNQTNEANIWDTVEILGFYTCRVNDSGCKIQAKSTQIICKI
jgi:hypothetical protein